MAAKDDTGSGRPEMTDEDRLAANLQQGHDHLTSGELDPAYDLLDEAITIARDLDDTSAEASACGLLAQVCLRMDRRDEADRHATAALQIALARRDTEAAEHFKVLQANARSTPDAIEMSTSFGDGRAALEAGNLDEARTKLERALELAKELGHGVAEAAACHLLARVRHGQGDKGEALDLARLALELATKQDDDQAVQMCRDLVKQIESSDDEAPGGLAGELYKGQTALASGDVEEGIAILERVCVEAQAAGEPVPEASACGLLAQAYIELDRQDDAKRSAERAAKLAEDLDHEGAAAEFRMLADMAAASEETKDLARGIEAGTKALEAGKLEQAVEALKPALALALEQDSDVAITLTSGLLATTLLALGRREDAAAHARRAREVSEKRGEEESVRHFDELLAQIEGD